MLTIRRWVCTAVGRAIVLEETAPWFGFQQQYGLPRYGRVFARYARVVLRYVVQRCSSDSPLVLKPFEGTTIQSISYPHAQQHGVGRTVHTRSGGRGNTTPWCIVQQHTIYCTRSSLPILESSQVRTRFRMCAGGTGSSVFGVAHPCVAQTLATTAVVCAHQNRARERLTANKRSCWCTILISPQPSSLSLVSLARTRRWGSRSGATRLTSSCR